MAICYIASSIIRCNNSDSVGINRNHQSIKQATIPDAEAPLDGLKAKLLR
jgi:hypothetical protein